MSSTATSLHVPVEAAMDACFDAGWTDGLPVVPPTPDRVAQMLGDRDGDKVLGHVPPAGTPATLHKVAINAVMAGCLPRHFPVVSAAMQAALTPEFNVLGVQATTHVAVPMIIVCGPIVGEIGLNASYGVFGPGCRANATIGRALHLALRNLGGAFPGVSDMSTFGNPLGFAGCVAERRSVSPWPGFHVDRGFEEDESTVTVFAGEAPKSIVATNDVNGILGTAVDTMSTLGAANPHLMGEMLLVVGPEHAGCLGGEGWSRRTVQEHLFQHARRPVRDFLAVHTYSLDVWRRSWPDWVDGSDPDCGVPIVEDPEDILILVAGGDAGRFSVCCPGWGRGGRAVTLRVNDDSGWTSTDEREL